MRERKMVRAHLVLVWRTMASSPLGGLPWAGHLKVVAAFIMAVWSSCLPSALTGIPPRLPPMSNKVCLRHHVGASHPYVYRGGAVGHGALLPRRRPLDHSVKTQQLALAHDHRTSGTV